MKIVGKFLENFFEQEAPIGTVNGTNDAFTLSFTPIYDKCVLIMVNGLVQRQGTDYTISGSNITFTTAPTSGSKINSFYLKR